MKSFANTFLALTAFVARLAIAVGAAVPLVGLAATPAVDRVSYFIDGSGSMCGYLRGKDPDNTFQTIVDFAMRAKDVQQDRHVFLLGFDGKKPSLIPAPDDLLAQVARRGDAKFARPCAAFVATQSSLNAVFTRARQAAGTSMILVTDLLLKEGELSSFVENVREWGSAPENEGAHVGFVTLRTPFDGPYFQVSGGKAMPGRHIRPLTVLWFAAGEAARQEVRGLLSAIGVRSTAPVIPPRSGLASGSTTPDLSAPAGQGSAATRAPATRSPEEAGRLLFGLQLFPHLTTDRSQWLVPLPDSSLDKWLDASLRMHSGAGRNAASVSGCAQARWTSAAGAAARLTVNVQRRCNDGEFFPYGQTSALIEFRPKLATGLQLDAIGVSIAGAGAASPPLRCIAREAQKKPVACDDAQARSDALELYRVPDAGESELIVKLRLRHTATDAARLAAAADHLDLPDDICPATARLAECQARLDGKVYRYATFVTQVSKRAERMIQQRVERWPNTVIVRLEVERREK